MCAWPANAQTLLFSGPSEAVNLELAKEWAQKLIGPSPKIDAGTHPDLHIYAPEGKASLHTVASMQTIVHEMALPPFEAPYKLFIICEAEKMQPAASNTLLKTLEEPPADTRFLLLSSAPEELLPTILSRCTKIPFHQPIERALSPRLAALIQRAEAGQWAELLKELTESEEELSAIPSDQLLEQLLRATDTSTLFSYQSAFKRIEEGRLALQHNVKLRTVLLQLLYK